MSTMHYALSKAEVSSPASQNGCQCLKSFLSCLFSALAGHLTQQYKWHALSGDICFRWWISSIGCFVTCFLLCKRLWCLFPTTRLLAFCKNIEKLVFQRTWKQVQTNHHFLSFKMAINHRRFHVEMHLLFSFMLVVYLHVWMFVWHIQIKPVRWRVGKKQKLAKTNLFRSTRPGPCNYMFLIFLCA